MKKLLFVLFVAQAISSSAQEFKPYFAAVVVSNIDSSIGWYKKVLDLELRNRTDAPERGFIQANLFNKEMLIELIQVDSSLSGELVLKDHPPRTRIKGFMKMGFIVKDIEGLFQQLKNQNIKFTGRMVSDPIKSKKTFLINDPDDNLIQFFER
jgi:catechol 2,3-dioxygenase-like lactoylglutathione lyase family enzyme